MSSIQGYTILQWSEGSEGNEEKMCFVEVVGKVLVGSFLKGKIQNNPTRFKIFPLIHELFPVISIVPWYDSDLRNPCAGTLQSNHIKKPFLLTSITLQTLLGEL